MTIAEIIEGCALGGISLQQRLTVAEGEEAELIKQELERRREEAMKKYPELYAAR
jgi:hypothetical protein